MNPAPDAELASVGEYNHRWIVDSLTDFILEQLKKGFDQPEYRWDAMLNPKPKAKRKTTAKKKTTKAKATKTRSKKASSE